MVPRKDNEEGGGGRGEKDEAFFRESVGVEKAAAKGLVAHGIDGLLIVPVEGREVEVGGRFINGPVEGVAPEEGVRDEGGEGEGETRVSACVVDALSRGTMIVLGNEQEQEKEEWEEIRTDFSTYISRSQKGIEDQGRVWEAARGDTPLRLHTPRVPHARPTNIWFVDVVIRTIRVAICKLGADVVGRRVGDAVVKHPHGSIRECGADR